MSDLPGGLRALDLDEPQLETLRPWARLFDQYGRQVPATRPYSAEEFLNWLLIERHMHSLDMIAWRRRAEEARRQEAREDRGAERRLLRTATS